MIRERLASPAERRRAQDFAALVEGRAGITDQDLDALATLATSLRPAPLDIDTGFKASLRAQLVSEAARRAPGKVDAGRPEVPAARGTHRLRQAIATGVALAVLGSAGAAVASTRALPGDTLYGLKREIENVQLSLAGSDLSRGRELLDQADHRLSEAEALAASSDARTPETRDRTGRALTEMDTAVLAGADALAQSYRTTGDTEPMRVLTSFAVDQQERLHDLMALLDPSLRARAGDIANLLAVLQSQAAAVTATSNAASVSSTGHGTLLADDDGWAVSRISQHAEGVSGGLSTVTGAVTGLTGSSGSGSGSGTSSGTGTTTTSRLVGGVTGTVSGLTSSGHTSTTPLSGLLSSPAPSPSPTSLTTVVPSTPLPCVPLPPATTC